MGEVWAGIHIFAKRFYWEKNNTMVYFRYRHKEAESSSDGFGWADWPPQHRLNFLASIPADLRK